MGIEEGSNFWSLYEHGFARVASCTVPCVLANPFENVRRIHEAVQEFHREHVSLVAFPELCVSGYSIDDLFFQDALLDAVENALIWLIAATSGAMPAIVVGAPIRHENNVYNCACIIHHGKLLGIVPKTYLPNYREFYERRWFAPASHAKSSKYTLTAHAPMTIEGADVFGHLPPRHHPFVTLEIKENQVFESCFFGTNRIFRSKTRPDFSIYVDICEDLWVPIPPSSYGALSGATVLVNISASNITIGKARIRDMLCISQSARCIAAYVYSAAGSGESTNDLAWDGQIAVYENGNALAVSKRFPDGTQKVIADVDLGMLKQERMRMGTFGDNGTQNNKNISIQEFDQRYPTGNIGLYRNVQRFPFVPAREANLAQDCFEAFNIQTAALIQRLRVTKSKLVIGISGGLDSTHALIVCAKAVDKLKRPRSDIIAVTMPGFATGTETKTNALELMECMGVTSSEIDIRPSCTQMLKDLGHPFGQGKKVYDITFENVQAGLRTDYLFRLANFHQGIVIGTGDLSELALGWCTYGVGDQMSHYAVNAGVPKTLIQHLIRWAAANEDFDERTQTVLHKILNTEISPELVPADVDAQGKIQIQSSELKIGPYRLQDFTLFYVLRYGFAPSKIAFLAWHAWHDKTLGQWPVHYPPENQSEYTILEIKKWLQVFIQRFFGFSQFKRTCLPNGPKVLAGGCLSPRSDWRMPSDSLSTIWAAELESNVAESDPKGCRSSEDVNSIAPTSSLESSAFLTPLDMP